MKIFITGAAGYIGSHAVLQALESGYQVIAFDSLERGFKEALDRVEKLTGKKIQFIQGDLRNKNAIEEALKDTLPDIVFHFAAYKSVGEGEQEPEKYFENNVDASINLIESMINLGIPKIIFSSTAAVYSYQVNSKLPFTEDTQPNPINVYGKTKLMLEQKIKDYTEKYKLKAIAFRYFNVAGAHQSGDIGEDTKTSTNLIPVTCNVLVGNKEKVYLFGNKFNTKDGSQERDYIHVDDIVSAHIKALSYEGNNFEIFNLSTGKSTSCLEIFKLAEEISGQKLNYEVTEPRKGDPEILYASSQKAQNLLGWTPKYNVKDCIKTYWNWIKKNPKGYSY